MKYDFFAEYGIKNSEDLDNLYNGKNRYAKVKDVFQKIKLLTTALNNRNIAKDKHKEMLNNKALHFNDVQKFMSLLGITFDTFTFNHNLPNYSFLLKLRIKLKRPYISKDDETFHICDNPIKKDKVFKIPIVASTTWKGNLRYAGMKYLEKESKDKVADRLALLRLFGHENKTEKDFLDKIMTIDEKTRYEQMVKKYSKSGLLQGRLTFFPTYFNKIRLEVINPHDRKTKAGKNPIFIESVPRDTTGDLFLLYCPFNLAQTSDDSETEIKKDLEILVEAIKFMFSYYGFGAKKKEYGYAEIITDNKVIYKKNTSVQEKIFSEIDKLKDIFDGDKK